MRSEWHLGLAQGCLEGSGTPWAGHHLFLLEKSPSRQRWWALDVVGYWNRRHHDDWGILPSNVPPGCRACIETPGSSAARTCERRHVPFGTSLLPLCHHGIFLFQQWAKNPCDGPFHSGVAGHLCKQYRLQPVLCPSARPRRLLLQSP